jgi:hypothetical protein
LSWPELFSHPPTIPKVIHNYLVPRNLVKQFLEIQGPYAFR